MYSWDLETFYTGKLSVESTEHQVRQGSYTERVWFMGGNPIGHLWGLLVVSNLPVEDSVLRITSDDKVVKSVSYCHGSVYKSFKFMSCFYFRVGGGKG